MRSSVTEHCLIRQLALAAASDEAPIVMVVGRPIPEPTLEVVAADLKLQTADLSRLIFIPRNTGRDSQPFYAGLYPERKGPPRNLRPKTH